MISVSPTHILAAVNRPHLPLPNSCSLSGCPAPLGEATVLEFQFSTYMIISFLGLVLKIDLFHEYECFACIFPCVPLVSLVPVEARRRCPILWNWVVLSYVSARN